MPVTDLSGGDDDWLQQFLAGHQAGQAFGASQPYGPGAVPGPYSGGSQGLMPGGGLYGRTQMTPGAPSMGYPGLGQPQAQQPPAAAPGPAQGLSLTNNPVMHALNALNPIGSAQAAEGPGVWNMRHGMPDAPNIGGLFSGILNAASQGQPTNSADLVGAGDTSFRSILPQARGVASPSPAAPMTANPVPRGGSGYGGVPPSGWGAYLPQARGVAVPAGDPNTAGASSGSPISPRRSYVGQQPGAGAPTGRPSQTPTPPQGAQSARIGTPFQYVVPNSTASRAPIYTAMNLFGGGQQAQSAPAQPAVNPANVPSPNAQTVSGGGPMPQATVNRLASNYPGRMAMSANQIASYIGTQPWLQNLGGPASQQMTPGALASAVRRPNWWGQFA